MKSIDFPPQYFSKKKPNRAALTSDVRDALLIELRLECAPSSWSDPSQGQIIYHPAVVKVTLFIGRSDPSPAIGEPPGPGCTDKMSCRQGDALAEGPVNKADGFHYTPFLLRVLSGAQPGAPNRAALSRLSPNLSWVFIYLFIYSFLFPTLYAGSCAAVLPAISFCLPVALDRLSCPCALGRRAAFCRIQSTCLNPLISAPTHLVHSVN